MGYLLGCCLSEGLLLVYQRWNFLRWWSGDALVTVFLRKGSGGVVFHLLKLWWWNNFFRLVALSMALLAGYFTRLFLLRFFGWGRIFGVLDFASCSVFLKELVLDEVASFRISLSVVKFLNVTVSDIIWWLLFFERFLVSVDVNFIGAASFGASRRLCLVDECPAALPYFWILEVVVFCSWFFAACARYLIWVHLDCPGCCALIWIPTFFGTLAVSAGFCPWRVLLYVIFGAEFLLRWLIFRRHLQALAFRKKWLFPWPCGGTRVAVCTAFRDDGWCGFGNFGFLTFVASWQNEVAVLLRLMHLLSAGFGVVVTWSGFRFNFLVMVFSGFKHFSAGSNSAQKSPGDSRHTLLLRKNSRK